MIRRPDPLTTEDVLAIRSIDEIRSLSIGDFAARDVTREEMLHIFDFFDAYWEHPGSADPTRPHALLTSGEHSNGFFHVLSVLKYTNLCQIFAWQLLRDVRKFYNGPIDWVVGSDHAAVALGHSVACILNAKHDFPAKGPDKTQVWDRNKIKPEEVVLQVEELVTTTSTLEAVRRGIQGFHDYPIRFALVAGVLVHRSKVRKVDDTHLIAVYHFDMENWKPDACPLCLQGSKAIRPKSPVTNWDLLWGRAVV